MGLVALWLHVLQQSLPCSQGTYMLLFPFLNVYLQNLLCSTLFMFHLEPMQSELKKIETKTEILQASVDEFNVKPLVSREELEKVYEELKKGKVDDSAVSARDIVEKEIENHAAWSCRVDYALASGGGYVVGHSDPYLVRNEANWFGTSRLLVYSKAVSMLTPSFGEPGNCFPLKGSNGYVQVRLRAPIIPEAVTLEHVSEIH